MVDNFQGEENNIILLSLVRSNVAGKVGFLRTDNRICVALSRAKQGLYITGNMDLLSNSSDLWKKVREDLQQDGCIGESLTLRCENHPDQLITVSTGDDFLAKSPEGGCLLTCGKSLPNCQHTCPKLCHMDDREHKEFKCLIPCPKILCELNHQCPKRCWERCGLCVVPVEKILPCNHRHTIHCHIPPEEFKCPTRVEKEIPLCQHRVEMACNRKPETYTCPLDCDTRLDCGHKCRQKCHRDRDPDHQDYDCREKCVKFNAGCTQNHPCQKKCYEECGGCVVLVKKTLPCGHEANNVHCSLPAEKVKCQEKCKKTLPCQHPCKKLCYAPCGDCQVKVKKTVPDCNHTATVSDKCAILLSQVL